jgi:hypothetical protein
MENSNDTIWNRTHDLPACSAVPKPIAPPAACPIYTAMWRCLIKHSFNFALFTSFLQSAAVFIGLHVVYQQVRKCSHLKSGPSLPFTSDIRKTTHSSVGIQRVTPAVRLRVEYPDRSCFINTHHLFSCWRLAFGQTYMETSTGVVTWRDANHRLCLSVTFFRIFLCGQLTCSVNCVCLVFSHRQNCTQCEEFRGVSETFGERYQTTNKTDTNKLTLLAFKIIAILHNTLLATFIKLLETQQRPLSKSTNLTPLI